MGSDICELLNIENSVLWSGLSSGVVLIQRWPQSEVPLYVTMGQVGGGGVLD